MKQIGLFDICEGRHGGHENSVDAATSIAGSTNEIRTQVLRFIERNGAYGATCDEIETGLGLSHQTASARCSELKRMGSVFEGEKRKTRSGRNASALVAVRSKCNFWEEYNG